MQQQAYSAPIDEVKGGEGLHRSEDRDAITEGGLKEDKNRLEGHPAAITRKRICTKKLNVAHKKTAPTEVEAVCMVRP
ncbi:TPA: hypothetical protein ACSP31_003897, partial [Aeromonas veronii]